MLNICFCRRSLAWNIFCFKRNESKSMKKKIVVIDDEADVLLFISLMLKSKGFEVITSNNANNVNELILLKPECILLDINMPGIRGTDICRMIKKDPKLSIPVIMISGNADVAIQSAACNANAYLEKPFAMEALLQTINRVSGAA